MVVVNFHVTPAGPAIAAVELDARKHWPVANSDAGISLKIWDDVYIDSVRNRGVTQVFVLRSLFYPFLGDEGIFEIGKTGVPYILAGCKCHSSYGIGTNPLILQPRHETNKA